MVLRNALTMPACGLKFKLSSLLKKVSISKAYDPTEFDAGQARLSRLATRIAIRQYAHLYPEHDVFARRQAFDTFNNERRNGGLR